MAVREDGAIAGSVSAGCVETAVVQGALAALAEGSARELDYGELGEEELWDVGLSCGGRVKVWIEPTPDVLWPSVFAAEVEAARTGSGAAFATRLSPYLRCCLSDSAVGLEAETGAQTVEGSEWFVRSYPRAERLIIVGAVHIAAALVRVAEGLGFEAYVIDPREALLSAGRFELPAERLIADWPQCALAEMGLDERTYAAVLSHDPKIDDAALGVLLKSPVRYIGALGGRATQDRRRSTLREMGFGEADLARLHGPIGLKIGAKSPEEIALSIAAEMVQVRRASS